MKALALFGALLLAPAAFAQTQPMPSDIGVAPTPQLTQAEKDKAQADYAFQCWADATALQITRDADNFARYYARLEKRHPELQADHAARMDKAKAGWAANPHPDADAYMNGCGRFARQVF